MVFRACASHGLLYLDLCQRPVVDVKVVDGTIEVALSVSAGADDEIVE